MASDVYVLEIIGDCRRRRLALKTLIRHGYEKFAHHVIEYNVPLFKIQPRIHQLRNKRYLMHDAMYHDSLLVRAILNKSVSSDVIHKLFMPPEHPRLATFLPSHMFQYEVTEFIEILEFPSTDKKEPDAAESVDDSVAYNQYLNDPYSVLMALFIRRDIPLIHEILDMYPHFVPYLLGTFQLFLIDETALEELRAIHAFVHYKYAYDFAIHTFTDDNTKSVKKRYKFLATPPKLESGLFYYFNPAILSNTEPPKTQTSVHDK